MISMASETPNPEKQLAQLIDQSFREGGKAKKSQRQLIDFVLGQDSYVPVLQVVRHEQSILLSSPDPRRLGSAAAIVEDLLSSAHSRNRYVINMDAKTIALVTEILDNHRKISTYPPAARYMGVLQNHVVDHIVPLILSRAGDGVDSMDMDLIDTSSGQSERLANYNGWLNLFNKEAPSLRPSSPSYKDKESILDLLSAEPEGPNGPALLDLESGDITLRSIITPPTSPVEQQAKIKDLIKYLRNLEVGAQIPNGSVRDMLFTNILFLPTYFDSDDSLNPKNRAILQHLNYLQEHFAFFVLYNPTSSLDPEISRIMQNLTENAKSVFLNLGLGAWIYSPLSLEPRIIEADGDFMKRHPFAAIVQRNELSRMSPGEQSIGIFWDEATKKAARDIIIPDVVKRFDALGLTESYEPFIKSFKEAIGAYPIAELQAEGVKGLFERYAGSEFIENLSRRIPEIDELTSEIWNATLEEGIHFIPMEGGVNTISFEDSGLPAMIGLRSLSMVRIGTEDGWSLRLSFTTRETNINLGGILNTKGDLEFFATIREKVPGLHSVLNQVAVAVFHDLVIQRKKESAAKEPTSRFPKRIQQVIDWASHLISPQETTSHGRLPRVQSDTDLTEDVYRKTHQQPRRVEIHPATLRGVKDYKRAIEEYQEALMEGSNDDLEDLKRKIEETRSKAYKITTRKAKSIPALLKLDSIVDPITGKSVYLQTWVVEHTNPKPTQQELESLPLLWRKYYKGGSAIASLDQLKEWFVS